MIPYSSPDLAAELGRRGHAPACPCGSWPLALSGFDGHGHDWRCAGCLLPPQKCTCARAPAVTLT